MFAMETRYSVNTSDENAMVICSMVKPVGCLFGWDGTGTTEAREAEVGRQRRMAVYFSVSFLSRNTEWDQVSNVIFEVDGGWSQLNCCVI